MSRLPASFAAALVLAAAVSAVVPAVAAADDATEPGVCLSVRLAELPDGDAWPAIIRAVDTATATEARPQLFPERQRDIWLGSDEAPALIAIWGDVGSETGVPPGSCTMDADPWKARISRTFLADGADRMLAVAPTTPGIASNVEVEWYPDEQRVRTWLEFEGPLSIPNGTCWIDDVLGVEDGLAVAFSEAGVRTSPFAESACGRFFDYLTRGGAGEQAVTLLPSEVPLLDGSTLAFVVSEVEVREDAIHVSGKIEIR